MYSSMHFRKKRHFYVNIDIPFQLAGLHYGSFTVSNETQSYRNIDMHALIHRLYDYGAEWRFLFQFVVETLGGSSDVNVYSSYISEFSCPYKYSEHEAHRDAYLEECQNALFSLSQLGWKASKERHCSLHNIVPDYSHHQPKQELGRGRFGRVYKASMQARTTRSLSTTLKALVDI